VDGEARQPRGRHRGQHGGDRDPAHVLAGFLLTKRDYLRPPSGSVNIEALQEAWDFFRERGGIDRDLEVTDHVIDGLLPPG